MCYLVHCNLVKKDKKYLFQRAVENVNNLKIQLLVKFVVGEAESLQHEEKKTSISNNTYSFAQNQRILGIL